MIRRSRLRCTALVVALCALAARDLAAQTNVPRQSLGSDALAVVGVSLLVGGATSAVRAASGGRNVLRAFVAGAGGGTLRGLGTIVSTRGKPGVTTAGTLIAATGASIVSNAAEGRGLLEELVVPLGPVRGRITTGDGLRFRATVNAFETAVVIAAFTRPGVDADWRRSAIAGAFVFTTRDRHIVNGADTIAGVASGPTVVLSSFAPDPDRTLRHEIAHVRQFEFFHEIWGRPLEAPLARLRWRGVGVPSWLELGVASPALAALEGLAFGRRDGPGRGAMEWEAKVLERR